MILTPAYRARRSAAQIRLRERRDDAAWFLARTEPEPNSGCWLWTGNYDQRFGYGMARGYPELKAHRLSYRLFVGPIPPGMWVLHRCDVKLCVNPAHLYAGDHAQNTRDAVSRDRLARVKGSKNGQAILREADIPGIRDQHRAGHSYREIAAVYGVSPYTIKSACSGESWQHV